MKKYNSPMNQLSKVLKTVHSFIYSFVEQMCIEPYWPACWEYSLCFLEASSHMRNDLH